MHLSKNIKRFRKAKGISQEYMCEKLFMSQSTYSRLEKNDSKCVRYLTRIAEVLDTTPDVLYQYHLIELPNLASESDISFERLLKEKDEALQSKENYIQFLNHFIEYTQAIWRHYLGGEL